MIKVLLLHPRLTLQPLHHDYPVLYPDPDELDIFGVVTWFLHNARGE